MCLSMALPLVCVAPAVVQQDKSNLAAIAPAWDAWAADDGGLTDRKVYGFDVGIKGGITSSDRSPRRASTKALRRWPRGLDFSHPVDALLI